MTKLNNYEFELKLQNGKEMWIFITSKHLNGAVRKLYQMYNIDEIVRIV